MYEVELKVPADHTAVRTRLEQLGAESIGGVRQVDTYYDAPHRSFVETDEALRIRSETPLEGGEPTTRITYKGPLLDDTSKSREEFETVVGNEETMATVLQKLGFEPAATVVKERDRNTINGYVVTLDTVEDVGEYVEVETEVNAEADLAAAREGAADCLESLDLDPDDQIRTSYLGLLIEG